MMCKIPAIIFNCVIENVRGYYQKTIISPTKDHVVYAIAKNKLKLRHLYIHSVENGQVLYYFILRNWAHCEVGNRKVSSLFFFLWLKSSHTK